MTCSLAVHMRSSCQESILSAAYRWLQAFLAGQCLCSLIMLLLCRFIAAHKKLSDWLFASLICGFGLPLSFFFWYFNLYKGAIRDSSFRSATHLQLHMRLVMSHVASVSMLLSSSKPQGGVYVTLQM